MRLAVLSSGRQDWGILRSTCLALSQDSRFDLRVILGGMHFLPHNDSAGGDGLDRGQIPIAEELRWVADGDLLREPTEQAAVALQMIGVALRRQRPDALLLVGDRFETAAAALAATLERVALVHLHGGEETEGAIDNVLRHAISRLSHLHLVSHEEHADRLRSLGEDRRSIRIVGAPGLDNATRDDLATRDELSQVLSIDLEPPLIIVTVHPTTLAEDPALDARQVAVAMDTVDATYVVSLPNVDPGSAEVRRIMTAASLGPRRVSIEALGERRYWGLLRIADAVLGNSSSALVEAPALGLPVVNVGDRQLGRRRENNVIDAHPSAPQIVAAMRRALSAEFRASLSALRQEPAAPRIVEALLSWVPPRPPRKPHVLAAR